MSADIPMLSNAALLRPEATYFNLPSSEFGESLLALSSEERAKVLDDRLSKWLASFEQESFRGQVILQALRSCQEKTGEEIAFRLVSSEELETLVASPHEAVFYINWEEFEQESINSSAAEDQLARIYKTITGFGQPEGPSALMLRYGLDKLLTKNGRVISFPSSLEKKWQEWVVQEKSAWSKRCQEGLINPKKLAAIHKNLDNYIETELKPRLKENFYYGGWDRETFARILDGQLRKKRGISKTGRHFMALDLALRPEAGNEFKLISIPPLPDYINELDISGHLISDAGLKHLPPNLTVFKARDNQLTHIPQKLPATMIELDLFGNNIGRLSQEEMGHLSNLKYLNLSENNLAELPSALGAWCPELETLRVSGNARLTVLPALLKLQSLDILGTSVRKFSDISSPELVRMRVTQPEWLSVSRQNFKKQWPKIENMVLSSPGYFMEINF
jgi:hypothetical protein